MQASAWRGGSVDSPVYGIRVGAPNRREFFGERWAEIEVEMDDTVHRFALTDGFWNKCPEFRDRGSPLIREWLRRHCTVDWEKGNPPKVELVPLGGNRFRLSV